MVIHLLEYKGEKGRFRTHCGKVGVPVQQVVHEDSLHRVTCCECLRQKIERLKDEVDECWMQQAGASR